MSFKDDMLADLAIFFNTDEFAETLTYDGVEIPAIISRFKDPDIAGNVATRAQILVKTSDVDIDYLDQVSFDNATWSVERVESSDNQIAKISVRRGEGYSFVS